LGPVVYFMPPYVISPEEIERMTEAARVAIDAATAD
jgi:adenosylmethionine-8-amino-7-oxononanoate aminotransferase